MAVIRDNIAGGALTETTLLVLLALCKPNHGYGIMQFIDKETNGRVVLGAGTLYGAINTLVKKKWIIPLGEEPANNKKKKYIITDAGKQKVKEEIGRMKDISILATKIAEEETV